MIKFEVSFLEPAKHFLDGLDERSRETYDPRLFKKLSGEIWEFRTKFIMKQFRFLAFWDRDDRVFTFVVTTHGFIKKTQRIPKREIQKAEQLRRNYFENK